MFKLNNARYRRPLIRAALSLAAPLYFCAALPAYPQGPTGAKVSPLEPVGPPTPTSDWSVTVTSVDFFSNDLAESLLGEPEDGYKGDASMLKIVFDAKNAYGVQFRSPSLDVSWQAKKLKSSSSLFIPGPIQTGPSFSLGKGESLSISVFFRTNDKIRKTLKQGKSCTFVIGGLFDLPPFPVEFPKKGKMLSKSAAWEVHEHYVCRRRAMSKEVKDLLNKTLKKMGIKDDQHWNILVCLTATSLRDGRLPAKRPKVSIDGSEVPVQFIIVNSPKDDKMEKGEEVTLWFLVNASSKKSKKPFILSFVGLLDVPSFVVESPAQNAKSRLPPI